MYYFVFEVVLTQPQIFGNGSKEWIKTCRVLKTRQVWNKHQRFRPNLKLLSKKSQLS
jgi:hypothetical protein